MIKYNNSMGKGKGQNKRQSQALARNHHSKTNIGRPQDDKLETFFMRKLRNGKLQVITAQSQAQIACHAYTDQVYDEEITNQDKVSYVKKWFEEIDQPRFKLLWKGFLKAAEKWQFKEINSISDFPEFLFCDECDLSYVLFQILNSDIASLKQKKQINYDELIYLQLLCFATRDQISFKIMRSIQKNLDFFLKMMDQMQVKNQVAKCSKEIVRDQKSQGGQGQNGNSVISHNLRKGQVSKTLSSLDEHNPGLSRLSKTKQIQKIEKNDKNDKKRGRPKKMSMLKEEDILEQSQFQEVGKKLISHIIRAYAYIYPSQIQKKGQGLKHLQLQQQQNKQQVAQN